MTRNAHKFVNVRLKTKGYVTYGDNNKGRILGCGDVVNGSSITIHNVLLVDGLKHNLVSISQLCDQGHKVIFEPNYCSICESKSDKLMLVGKRVDNIYMLDIHHASSKIEFFLTKEEDLWLWHKRISHIHMHHLNKGIFKDLVNRLPKLKFKKVTKVSFKQFFFLFSTIRPLKVLHMNFFVLNKNFDDSKSPSIA